MSNKFSEQYLRLFKAASNGDRLPSRHAVALKGLEEYVEFLFAAGADPVLMMRTFQAAHAKESERGTTPCREGVVAEIADVTICLKTFLGLRGIEDAEVDIAVDEKHAINADRNWRVNEFGSLSHMKGEMHPDRLKQLAKTIGEDSTRDADDFPQLGHDAACAVLALIREFSLR